MDAEYYGVILAGKRRVAGLTVLHPSRLVPLKARAWIDPTKRRERGEQVDSNDIKKHRSDVLRLSQLIAPTDRVILPDSVRQDLVFFVENALQTEPGPSAIGIQGMSLEYVRSLLASVYEFAESI